jgi:hypothetical protein
MEARTRLAAGAGALLCCAGLALGQPRQQPAQQPAQPALPDIFRMPEAKPAPAQPAPDSLEGLIAALDADAFPVRDEATETLRERAAELESALEHGAIDPDRLSPEQRKRVADVLEAHFYETPRAGLGVQFKQGNPAGNGISLQMVLGEFPASRVLIADDEIRTVDGVEMHELPNTRAMELLRAMIIARSPGDTLPMTIQRGGVTHELDVELGDFRNLGAGAGVPQEIDLLRAWEIRRTALGLADDWDGRIQSTLSRRDWPNSRRPERINPAASIFAGGTSQTANVQLLAWGLPLRQRAPGDEQRLGVQRLQQERGPTLDERRTTLRAQVEQLQLLAQITEQRANDLNAGEAQRRESAMRLVQIRARISELRNELERLERR